MKISIFSFAVNDKFPIDIVHRQYAKYMKENFEFILFNDAFDSNMEQNINTIASHNNIKCVRVPQNIHSIQNPSLEYAATINWAVHNYACNNNCEIIGIVHTDVFPICDVYVSSILGENIIASTTEFRIINEKAITYLYPALTFVNMTRLKNVHELDFGVSPGLDVGGKTSEFIKNNAGLVKLLPNHQTDYFLATLQNGDKYFDYFKDDLDICKSHGLSAGWISEGFYHYMAGSQWNAHNRHFADGHLKRMKLFLNYFY
jgi:hypothetical protein